MKKTLGLLVLAICVLGCGRADTHFSSPAKPILVETPYSNPSYLQLGEDWQQLAPNFNAIQETQSESPRFDLYLGYTVAMMLEKFASWKVVGGDPKDVRQANEALADLPKSIDATLIQTIFPIKSADDLDLVRAIFLIYGLSGEVFISQAGQNNLSVEIQKPLSLDLQPMKKRVVEAKKIKDHFQTACYWLGFMAREAEKNGNSLNDFWQACNLNGTDTQIMDQIIK